MMGFAVTACCDCAGSCHPRLALTGLTSENMQTNINCHSISILDTTVRL